MEFENISAENMFGFIVADPQKQTQTSSPKTGENSMAALTALLGLSGIVAFIFKKERMI